MQTVCVIGLGYIGLPSAALLASNGYLVHGVDIDSQVVDSINNGKTHIVEPGLDVLVSDVVSRGLLSAHLSPLPADVYIITVPTPFRQNSADIPQPNLDYVREAVESILPYLVQGNLVLLESTSPVGTTRMIAELIYSSTSYNSDNLHIAYCPERVIPGKTLTELVTNDRVIGGYTQLASQKGCIFYESFCEGDLFPTSSVNAELVKLVENSFRDVNIAFANEVSLVCDSLSVDVFELIRLANRHPRVNILKPGCGVGGHCIAVDPWFIASSFPDSTPLIQAARRVNDYKSTWVVEQIKSRALEFEAQSGRPAVVGCLGLAFKPDVDDLRESPALHITTELLVGGLLVLACEPNLLHHHTIKLHSLDDVLSGADLLVFLVSHSSFKGLDLSGRNVFDLCGVTGQV